VVVFGKGGVRGFPVEMGCGTGAGPSRRESLRGWVSVRRGVGGGLGLGVLRSASGWVGGAREAAVVDVASCGAAWWSAGGRVGMFGAGGVGVGGVLVSLKLRTGAGGEFAGYVNVAGRGRWHALKAAFARWAAPRLGGWVLVSDWGEVHYCSRCSAGEGVVVGRIGRDGVLADE